MTTIAKKIGASTVRPVYNVFHRCALCKRETLTREIPAVGKHLPTHICKRCENGRRRAHRSDA